MDFEERFPRLYQFLGAYFPDADCDGLTDVDVCALFASELGESDLERMRAEYRDLLELPEFPWREISRESNRYFANEAEGAKWLAETMATVETRFRELHSGNSA